MQSVPFKLQSQTIIMYCNSEMKIRSWSLHVIIFQTFILTGELVSPCVQKLSRCEHGTFTSRICVHSQILLHIKIIWWSFGAAHEAFSGAYPGKEVLNKTIILLSPVSLRILFQSGLHFKWYFLCTCHLL
jgi:hypothetical protein